MRSLASGGELLRANMVLMVWVGFLLKRGELMGKFCGDSFIKGGEDFFDHFSFQVGDGSSIYFWHDRWYQEGSMRDLFPLLFVLAEDKDATIADYCHRGSSAVVWTPIFIRDAFVSDISLAAFLNLLNGFFPLDSPDAVIWNLNSRGAFTVKSYYLKLLCYPPFASQTVSGGRFPWKIIWKSLAPLRVSVFVWEASYVSILTCDNLQKKGIVLVNRCSMCKEDLESSDHLLLH